MNLLERMVQLHGPAILQRSALRLDNGDQIIAKMLAGAGYRTVLEIGTYRGCTAAFMAQYCAKVITIDLTHGQLEREGVAFIRRAFWASLGINNVDLYLVQDDPEKSLIVDKLDFDFAFIDGAHDAGVAFDFEIVKRCGRVLFHDYDGQRNFVHEFVNSLPPTQVQVFGSFALWTA